MTRRSSPARAPRTRASSASAATARPGSCRTRRSSSTIDSSDEWIRSRSGIATRHWAGRDETVAAMSVEASGKAIADAGHHRRADRRA